MYNLSYQDASGAKTSSQLTQDIGQADRIYNPEESLQLRPNVKKINVFTSDGSRSLIKGVEAS